MKIAITADPYIPVPPRHYGGIERVVDFLSRGLLARGHDVTLFAHPESRIESRLVPYGVPPHTGLAPRMRELWQVGSELWKCRERFDLVHSFGRLAALVPVLPLRSLPKIQSFQRDELPKKGIRRAVKLAGASLRFTACSTQMYANEDVAGEWTTVFNGVDLDKYSFASEVEPDAPFVFLGRLERVKGVHHAIAIARATSRRLVLAGNVASSGPEAEYFEREIAPALDDDLVRYVGPVDDEAKNELLGCAAALVMSIEWEEPFGIVMAEAMACGTPVIGFARGSVREVVRDGVNGFVCDGVEAAVAAVARLGSIRRSEVRRDAEARFGADVIVSEYETLYGRMLAT